MASSALFVKLLCVALVGMVALAPHAKAISCGQVTGSLAPCLSYISGGALNPSCCGGIKSLLGQAKTKPDRQAICGCMKDLAARVPGSSAGAGAGKVVKGCKISIPYALHPHMNCATIE